MAVNVPTALLRSFIAIVDSGSMLAAADQVYVTPSALSLQVKRLEEILQRRIFEREGRRLALTTAGELLLDYARRVLALHDEAIAALSGAAPGGPVRIGMVQDFADLLLTGVLARFSQLHGDAQIYARVAGTAELQELITRNEIDFAVGFASAGAPGSIRDAPSRWYGDSALADRDVVPLAVLERPCRFREAAIAALERARRRYRLSVETPNLSTLRSAVAAGLGLTVRTPLFLHDITPLDEQLLPPLPSVACMLLDGREPNDAVLRLRDVTIEAIRDAKFAANAG